MKKFIVLYSGGSIPTTPEEGDASMKEWTKWFETLGASVSEVGAPFGNAKTVSGSGIQDGPSENVSNGYSIIEAENLGAAAKLVKSCPIIEEKGKIHVFELIAM